MSECTSRYAHTVLNRVELDIPVRYKIANLGSYQSVVTIRLENETHTRSCCVVWFDVRFTAY